ncbi:MAG: hypothetical protein IPK08_20050 [Bacteroidetes bacterium]|nr:hypothetical protein [Bacteroidota bacterium]
MAPAVDNNQLIIHFQPVSLVNSFDPNSKFTLEAPSGAVDTAQTMVQLYSLIFKMSAMVRQKIFTILDSLSSNSGCLIISFLSSSHGVITQLLTGNVLRLKYPDINLPDSVNDEPRSHG